MSYVLDGIKTAMTSTHEDGRHRISCPCGWSIVVDYDARYARKRTLLRWWFHHRMDRLFYDVTRFNNWNVARFHHTHCPQAKVDRREGEDG